jgi:hypothetical protein
LDKATFFSAFVEGRMTGWVPKLVALVVVVTLILGSIIVVHNLALDDLRARERYTITFADIDCTPPYGQDRAEFLDEVRYYASAPNYVRLLDADLAERLAGYFGRHPWVEKVEVEITQPRTIRVKPVYRTPVLAVAWQDVKHRPGGVRAVDGHGILLPKNAPTAGLAMYPGYAAPPSGPEGTPWGDVAVEAAAHKAAH